MLGKTIKWWGHNCVIVGVTSDFNIKPLRDGIGPVAIGSRTESEYGFSVRLRSGRRPMTDMTTTLRAIEKCWQEVFPDEPFEYQFYDQRIANFIRRSKKWPNSSARTC